MSPSIPFLNPDVTFDTSGPRVVKVQINLVLPFDFPGKDDFIQFYLSQNGGNFYKPVFHYRDTFYKVSKSEINVVNIEYFYSIPRFLGDEDMSLIDAWELKKLYAERLAEFSLEQSQKLQKFTETHFPFAGGASGTFWIDIKTGHIKLLDNGCGDDDPDHAPEIAFSFRDFCAHLQRERRSGEK